MNAVARRWFVVIALIGSARVDAGPLQLRADALATTASPAGLLTLEADGSPGRGLSAEAVVWMGSADDARTDVLVMVLRAHTADGWASARVGRFVASLGALRPVQIDGAAGRLRLPLLLDLEAMAGIPVEPGLMTARSWNWIAGGRLARRIGDGGSIGVAYTQRRDDARLASEELGVDAGLALGRRDDVGAKLAYDLANPGIAEIALTASHRSKALRTELYGGYRSASHLLPATSLFTVLGDVPAERAGAVATWRAAPRLDVIADVGARRVDRDIAPAMVLRARLRLDDGGASAVTGELRRDGVGDDMWTGARCAARIALPRSLAITTEVELVRPDLDRGRGTLWPWALAALGWDDGTWQAALAVEASASPEDRRRVDVLGQLGRRWGAR
ncbi:MAG TPA: hypothetical protein VFD36_17265 [Kofleriaceae bacterium]|jgi:hypothetical protein|nr:hypothetical protein [Kofleriaceae bacterium]